MSVRSVAAIGIGAIYAVSRVLDRLYQFFLGHLPVRAILLWLLLAFISPLSVRADNVNYSYDQLGRVVQAANSTSGQATQYSYDAAGNITAIKNVAVATVSIAGFSPTQGSAGTSVTISGTGFDATTPANNIIKFNTTAATVVSATANQIIATVPSGATTGAVSVTNAAGTATGGTFTIAASLAPHITSFTPATAGAGDTVAITGTNFQPLGQDNVLINQSSAHVATASATSMGILVPPDASSGKISVTTAYGTTLSSAVLYIAPGHAASSIGTTGALTVGTAGTVSLPTASKIAVESFSGTVNQYLTLGITNDTVAAATITVYNPNGSQLTSQAVTTSTTGLQLPRLPATGTYSIVIDPGTNTGSMTLTLISPVTGTITVGGAALPLALTPAGQRGVITFTGAAGQYLTLGLSGNTIAAANITILTSTGFQVVGAAVTTSTPSIQIPKLAAAGTYTVLVDPGSNSGNITLTLVGAQSGTLTVGGAAQTLTLSPPGQRALLSFSGTAGQYLTLILSQVTIPSGTVSVLNSSGTVLSSIAISTSGGALQLPKLPQAGTYSVLVDPGLTSGNITLALKGPLTATATPNPPQALVLTMSDSSVRSLVSFAATPGKYLTLTVQENTTCYGTGNVTCPPTGSNFISGLSLTVFAPDGSVVQTPAFPTNCNVGNISPQQCFGDAVINLGLIPSSATGNYTVLVQQTAANFGHGGGSLQFWLTYPSDFATGSLFVNQGDTTFNAAYPGQGMLITFNLPTPQSVSLPVQETNQSIPVAQISLINPQGTPIRSAILTATCGCDAFGNYSGSTSLPNNSLASGTWTILVQQQTQTSGNNAYGSLTGQLHFNLTSP